MKPTISNDQARPAVGQNRRFLSICAGHSISILGDGFHGLALGLCLIAAGGAVGGGAAAGRVASGVLRKGAAWSANRSPVRPMTSRG
ncbi:MAG: hypothetical protein JWN15_4033 [Firmicutes bacterium]|nr:hypothetical protein [Bacillota bacterium]